MSGKRHLTPAEWRDVGRHLRESRSHLWEVIVGVQETVPLSMCEDIKRLYDRLAKVKDKLEIIAEAQHPRPKKGAR